MNSIQKFRRKKTFIMAGRIIKDEEEKTHRKQEIDIQKETKNSCLVVITCIISLMQSGY